MVYLPHLSALHFYVHKFCVVSGKKTEDKVQAAQSVIERLPEDNYEVLKFVVEFLVEVLVCCILSLLLLNRIIKLEVKSDHVHCTISVFFIL